MVEEIESADPNERRRTVMAHRLGVSLFLLLLLAALAGLVGEGPLSKAQAASGNRDLQVNYLRFVRYQAPASLKMHISAGAARNGLLHVQLSRSFVDNVELESIQPQPESATVGPGFITYAIRAETNQPVEVKVRFSADHFGRLRYTVGLATGSHVLLQHLAFP